MTDDRAERALRDALARHLDDADFAPLDPAALRSAAEASTSPVVTPMGRRRPRFLLVAAAAVVAVMVLPVSVLFLRGAPGSATTAQAPAGGVPQATRVAETPEAARDTMAADAAGGGTGQEPAAGVCPTAEPPFGGIADFAALLVWEGRTYVAVLDESAELGPVVGEVRCSIYEISEGGTRMVTQPWPDGSSTFLPAGAPIHAVVGEDPRCTLGVTMDGRDIPLRAENTPGC